MPGVPKLGRVWGCGGPVPSTCHATWGQTAFLLTPALCLVMVLALVPAELIVTQSLKPECLGKQRDAAGMRCHKYLLGSSE